MYCSIGVEGSLDADWSDWFDGLTVTNPANGTTTLTGSQARESRRGTCVARPSSAYLACVGICGDYRGVPGNETDFRPTDMTSWR